VDLSLERRIEILEGNMEQLRDVPAGKLAFKFSADVDPPNGLPGEESKSIPAIQDDFDARRKDEALLRTVPSPDGQRALALYGAADDSNTKIYFFRCGGGLTHRPSFCECALIQKLDIWCA